MSVGLPLQNHRKPTKGKLRAEPSRVPTDPRCKPDDPCIVCGETRGMIAVANEDPFCSSVCCRLFYCAADH